MPKLTINGIEVEVEPGTSILQAAEQIGVEVPRFCYHDRLSVPANCRMCLVEVKGGPPKPVASCAMACGDNMEVLTDSPMVHKARKGVMEFLLINHPLDCPICDQGGECDLQDQAVSYGFDRSRYGENKRAVTDKYIGPLIKTSMTRCIQCTRCIRFSEEIAGISDLGLLHRGEDVEIDTMIEKAVDTELSGNLADVCPVGALLNKPYAFRARPWELTRTETIDVHDAVGSNIRVDSRGGEVMRVLPRLHEDVNEEWIADRTRYAHDGLKRQRLDRPYVRDAGTGRLREASWEEAFMVIADRIRNTPLRRIGALAGDLCDVESMVALKDLLAAAGIANTECRTDGARFDASVRAGYLFNATIAGIEQADAIMLIGTNPRWEAAMVNARIRKHWLNTRVPIGVWGEDASLNYPVRSLGNGTTGFAQAVKDFFAQTKAERPMMIIGSGAFERADGAAIHALMHQCAQEAGVVKDGWNGFNILHRAASRVGALDIGFIAEEGFAPQHMDFLWLLGADDIGESFGFISDNAFVVYQGHHGDRGAARADVVLPGAAYTEKDGLYVNMEGRVQMGKRAVHPPGDAREDWKIIRAFSDYVGATLPYNDLGALRARIVAEWPHFGIVDVIQQAPWESFGVPGNIAADGFRNPLSDYYMPNVICRASQTMAECMKTYHRGEELAEAAE